MRHPLLAKRPTLALRRLLLSAALLSVCLAAPAELWATVPIHKVVRAPSPIDVDGTVDEAAWQSAVQVDLDFEVQPGENVTPPVKTVCLVTYDDDYVYFAFRADDPEPELIRARYSDRDRAWDDDWVGIVLDTFNDQRRAYELFSTPLGVQIDAINDDVGGQYDDSWNAIWKSAGRITDSGYEVEMAIPFSQIRFQQIDGEQIWGFDALRSWPREYRHHIGAFPRDRANNSYLTQAIKLTGMSGVSPGRNIEVIPTVTSSRSDELMAWEDADLTQGDVDSDVGVSLRWGITPSMSLNGAVNPDFSQVEADALQLDVNEQFALFYGESRPFFKEGADYFNTDLLLVHTRAVANPSTAVKLTGKEGSHTWGMFTARDDVTNILVPGVEGSVDGSFAMDNTSTAGRYRYDFGANSMIGATVTDRRGSGYGNSVYSIDTVYRITDKDKINTSVAFTNTEYNDEMVDELGVESGSHWGEGFIADYTHRVRNWWVMSNFSHFGEEYRTDLGFQPSNGYRSLWVGGAKVWWGKPGATWHRSAWGTSYSRDDRLSGGLIKENFETWANTQGPMQSLFSVTPRYTKRSFDGEDFDLVNVTANANMQVTGNLGFAFTGFFGNWIDFSNTQPADRLLLRPTVEYTFGKHVNLRYSHIFTRLERDEGRLYTVHAPELRAIHQFNTRAYLRLVMQYTSIDRNPSLYESSVDAKSTSLLTQLLFSYKVNPQTALYVGYGDNYYGDQEMDLTRTGRTFFAKLGYAWLG